MKTFIFTPTEKGRHLQVVQLITKRSNGDCFVIRQYKSEHTAQMVTKRFWTHKDTLSKPERSGSTKPKSRPGVKQAKPDVKRLFKLVTEYHKEKNELTNHQPTNQKGKH